MIYFPAPRGQRNLLKARHSGSIRTSEANEETIQIGIVRPGHDAKVKLYPFSFSKNSRVNYIFFLKSSFAAKIGLNIYASYCTSRHCVRRQQKQAYSGTLSHLKLPKVALSRSSCLIIWFYQLS